jgi:hypothetical protein
VIDPQAKFSEDETRQIIARAASRQEQAERVRLGTGTGLTLEVLQDVGRDAGIDPLHIEAAAKDVMLRRDASPVKTRLGLPLELRAQRVVPGSVSDAQWERMVTEFRQTFRKSGTVSQFGPVREWISEEESSNMPVKIRLEPVDERTVITLRQSTKTASEMAYVIGGTLASFGAMFGVFVGMGAFGPGGVVLPILFGVLAVLSSLGIWGGYRAWMPRQEERFRALLDRTELIARAP